MYITQIKLYKADNCKAFLLLAVLVFCSIYLFYGLPGFAQDENVAAQENSEDLLKARQLMIDGTEYLHSNQNDLARQKLSDACLAAPNLPQAHHQLGIALAKLGENEQAIGEFSTAIKLDANMAASWLNLAAVYQSAGNIDEAKNTYQQFIDRFPQDRDIAKIRNLLAALNKETASQPQASKQDLVDKASVPAGGNIIQQKLSGLSAGTQNVEAASVGMSSSDVDSTDDYYHDIAKRGVWLWQKDSLPLAVYIELPNSNNGATAKYVSILKNAFKDWVTASDKSIGVVFVDSPSQAVISCRWSKDCAKFKNSSEAANTRVYAGKNGLNKGEIEILTVSTSTNAPISENQARATCLHEVGHVLGLTGHSMNAQDAMYISATLQDKWVMLSNRDKNTIRHLYSGNK